MTLNSIITSFAGEFRQQSTDADRTSNESESQLVECLYLYAYAHEYVCMSEQMGSECENEDAAIIKLCIS